MGRYKATLIVRLEADDAKDARDKISNMLFEAEYDGIECPPDESIIIEEEMDNK